MRGVGWHNIYPLSGATPVDRGLQRQIARRIKDAGFNFCRFHTHCRFPEIFEVADELGIMLQPELPYYCDVPCNGQVFDPFSDARELYENYRRYPSFAVLSGGNEGSYGPVTSKRFYEFYKRLDPDRVVIGQDGFNNVWTNGRGTSDYRGGPMNVWPRGSLETDVPFVAHEYLNLSVKVVGDGWGGGLYVKAGSIIPMWPEGLQCLDKGWNDKVELHVWPGADGAYDLYEDDGDTLGYLKGEAAVTHIDYIGGKVIVGETKGAFPDRPDASGRFSIVIENVRGECVQ